MFHGIYLPFTSIRIFYSPFALFTLLFLPPLFTSPSPKNIRKWIYKSQIYWFWCIKKSSTCNFCIFQPRYYSDVIHHLATLFCNPTIPCLGFAWKKRKGMGDIPTTVTAEKGESSKSGSKKRTAKIQVQNLPKNIKKPESSWNFSSGILPWNGTWPPKPPPTTSYTLDCLRPHSILWKKKRRNQLLNEMSAMTWLFSSHPCPKDPWTPPHLFGQVGRCIHRLINHWNKICPKDGTYWNLGLQNRGKWWEGCLHWDFNSTKTSSDFK